MPITMQQVLARLDTDEPDYASLSTLGPEAVPHLKVLVKSEDPGIAAKAAYLASMIESDESLEVVKAASASPHETVRVAAAASMRNLAPAQAGPWVERLLDDKDAGVRKQALRAVADLGMSGLESKVKKMASGDPETGLRKMARQGLRQRRSESQSAGPVKDKPKKKVSPKRVAGRTKRAKK